LAEIGKAIAKHQISILWLTAGLFHLMVDECIEDLRPVRQLLAGGDVLSVSHVRRVVEELPNCTLINGYGPTENTTFTCCYTVTDIEKIVPSVPIGRPIANTQVYILDQNLQPVPIGVPGELYTGGDGLARSYFNRPELTNERFIPNPFSSESNDCLYKTGDMARYLPDGNIEFFGRIDNQVKIRGFRIELDEIKAALDQYAAIKESVVIVREDVPGEKVLAGYFVPISSDTEEDHELIADLRQFLKGQLPDFMVPSSFMALEKLPLTPNGKIDRKVLPKPDATKQLATSYVAPSNDLELQIAEIWAEVLNLERVGIHDNFFELGGYSLLAIQIVSRLRKVLNVEILLPHLFELPTVYELARRVQVLRWAMEGTQASSDMADDSNDYEEGEL
jgi:acyl-coenzyme A synthetase/AMP-(fatty) acid ligase/acyl carrier protein